MDCGWVCRAGGLPVRVGGDLVVSYDIRLGEIQERAKIARQVLTSGTTGAPPNVSGVDVYEAIDILAESAIDVPVLVAALRAVLAACDTYEKTQGIYRIEMGQREIIRVVRAEIEAALKEGGQA